MNTVNAIISGRPLNSLSAEELLDEYFLAEEYATILPDDEREIKELLWKAQEQIEKLLGFDPCAPVEGADGEDYVPVDVALSSYRGDTNWEEIPW